MKLGEVRHGLIRAVHRVPFTATMVVAILTASSLAGLFTHPLAPEALRQWGFGWDDLTSHRFGHLLTAPFLVLRPYMAVTISAILLFFVGTCELLWRSRRTVIAFVVSHVVGYTGALILLESLGRLGWPAAAELASHPDVGASNGAFGAAGALLFAVPVTIRRIGLLSLLAYLVGALVVERQLWDVQHMIAFSSGLVIGAVYRRIDRTRMEDLTSSVDVLHRQRAHLMGWLVGGMGAVNVLAAVLLPRHQGFERLESLLPFGLVHAPRMSLLFAGLTLLVGTAGLRRAQRAAWWLAFVMLIVTTYLQLQLGITKMEALFAFLFLLLLVAWKDDFPAPSDPPSVAGARRFLVASILGVPAVGWLAVMSLRREFVDFSGPVAAMGDVLRRLFYLAPLSLEPAVRRTDWILEAIPAVFWAGLLMAVTLGLRAARAPRPGRSERANARRLVGEHGRTSTAFMTSWPGNSYCFAPGDGAFLAYRVQQGVAVALGDPIGPASQHANALRAFVHLCRDSGWIPALLAVSGRDAEVYESGGFRLLQIGEEAVIDLEGLEFKGKPWQNMRSALHRAQREGLRFELYEGGRVPPEIVDQMRDVEKQWTQGNRLPPMEFTLGSLDDVRDADVEVAVAIDATGRLHGFVDWLPVPAERGWVIDLMRRRPDSMNGTMEFLIGMSMLAFQQRGERFVSLATAPLADLDRDAETALVPRILEIVFSRFETFYDFKSLFDFKDRFQPRWEPVYLAYRDPVELPTIAVAVLRAHLPSLGWTGAVQLFGSAVADRLRSGGLQDDSSPRS